MNGEQVVEWADAHKPVVIGGGAALVLVVLIARHRARAQGGDAGPTTQDSGGQYLVPYDGTSGDASGGDGGQAGGVSQADIDALTLAITGLTTTVADLDPTTGPANDGTDGGGGHTTPGEPTTVPTKGDGKGHGKGGHKGDGTKAGGHPHHKKPTPVHHAKHPTPPHKLTGNPLRPIPAGLRKTQRKANHKPPHKLRG